MAALPPANLNSNLAPAPRYYSHSFENTWCPSPHARYSDSPLDPSSSLSQYGYDSSNLAPRNKHNRNDSFSARVYTAFSDAVRPSTCITPPQTSADTAKSRVKSVTRSAGPMLARASSVRLGGLLNRTPTQKQQNKQPDPNTLYEEEASDMDEPEDLPEYKPAFTSTPDRTARPSTQPTSAKSKRFTWFSQPKTTADHTAPTAALELSDPLLDLNVNAALFPTGASDPLHPDSFNSLLTNACALVTKLQAGYRQKTTLLKQANAERDAVREESEEASTRVAHLKSQLETMALKAAEQDRAMQDLAEELTQTRARLESRRHDSIRPSATSEPDVTPRRGRPTRGDTFASRARVSGGSLASDSDLESDLDFDSASCSLDTASTTSVPPTPFSECQPFEDRLRTTPGKNVSTAGAWGVVGDLQRENQRLRVRVRELEGAVEGCLSLVGR